MALTPQNHIHKMQIVAGTEGRKRGHKFESTLANEINKYRGKTISATANRQHIFTGNPAKELLQYISSDLHYDFEVIQCWWLGGLATSGEGDILTDGNGNPITKCKSDILLKINTHDDLRTIGVSVKTCNKKTPTNDQMFFTTAKAFCLLLKDNGIDVSKEAKESLSMFCGDHGYRPLDLLSAHELSTRSSDPNRFYWEELPGKGQLDWKAIFDAYQDKITLLLFQKAYKTDPYPPDYLLHQTVKYDDFNACEVALFSMQEIVKRSRDYSGFFLSEYVIRKGTYKNDNSVHLAPRFGFIQFQRGGQKQHPTQLQFNLKAGYFRHI